MNMTAKESPKPSAFEGWALLEIFGHRMRWGFVTEVEIFGAKKARIDVHSSKGVVNTEFYSGDAIFCLTPTTEEAVKTQNDRWVPPPTAALPPREPRQRVHCDDESPCRDDDCMRDQETDGAFEDLDGG